MGLQDKDNSGTVKAAIIGGIFAIIAGTIGGIFLIMNTIVDIKVNQATTVPISETQNQWEVIQSVFNKELENNSDYWQEITLVSNLNFSSDLEIKLGMESIGANIIVLSSVQNSEGVWWKDKRMEIACEEGTLGIHFRDGTTEEMTFDNDDNRPEMPVIGGKTNCQIIVKFNQFAKNIQIFQSDMLIFNISPKNIGDFPEGLFPNGTILNIKLTSAPKEGNTISSAKLNELSIYAPIDE